MGKNLRNGKTLGTPEQPERQTTKRVVRDKPNPAEEEHRFKCLLQDVEDTGGREKFAPILAFDTKRAVYGDKATPTKNMDWEDLFVKGEIRINLRIYFRMTNVRPMKHK